MIFGIPVWIESAGERTRIQMRLLPRQAQHDSCKITKTIEFRTKLPSNNTSIQLVLLPSTCHMAVQLTCKLADAVNVETRSYSLFFLIFFSNWCCLSLITIHPSSSHQSRRACNTTCVFRINQIRSRFSKKTLRMNLFITCYWIRAMYFLILWRCTTLVFPLKLVPRMQSHFPNQNLVSTIGSTTNEFPGIFDHFIRYIRLNWLIIQSNGLSCHFNVQLSNRTHIFSGWMQWYIYKSWQIL